MTIGFNQDIIKELEKSCENKDLKDFIIEVFYEEFEHSGNWHWKEFYNKKIEEFSKKMGEFK